MEKHVIVPQADIDKLEEAREYLCNKLYTSAYFPSLLTHVTPSMHKITHRKYQEYQGGL